MAIALRGAVPAAACITQRLIDAGQPLGATQAAAGRGKIKHGRAVCKRLFGLTRSCQYELEEF